MLISTNTKTACLILLTIIAQLFSCESTAAQSSVASLPRGTSNSELGDQEAAAIPNSITKPQLATEEILAQPIAEFGVAEDIELKAAEFFETLELKFLYDSNIEGLLDEDTELKMTAGVSLYRSLSHALLNKDAVMTVESDGTISLISIDDELEPSYLKTVIYDVSSLTNSTAATQQLILNVQAIVDSDSWDANGAGNATVATFELNGSMLMSINNSYRNHLKIRSLLSNMQKLGRSAPGGANRVLSNPSSRQVSRPLSRVVDPQKKNERPDDRQ